MPSLLVFGARNLGRSVARHMAGLGWDVAAVARSADSLERLAAEVDGALTLRGDVRVAADAERAFAEARVRFEAVDFVVVAISPTQRGRTFGGGEVADLEPSALSPYLAISSPVSSYLQGQSPRGWKHELQITPARDRWLP